MSYYGPSFGGLDNGWFRNSQEEEYAKGRKILDSVWTDKCDEILTKYVYEYGTYFTAFDDQILTEIEFIVGEDLSHATGYHYYISNRVLELDNIRIYWENSHEREKSKSFICKLCNEQVENLHCHPTAVRIQGLPLNYCYDCSYKIEHAKPNKDKVRKLILERFNYSYLSKTKPCEICGQNFSSENHLKAVKSFNKSGGPFLDYLYPNLFIDLCPKCFSLIFTDDPKSSNNFQFKLLHDLTKVIGRTPVQNYHSFFYLCRNHHSMLALIKILIKLRSPVGFKNEFGSFFAALVQSNVLTDGKRKTSFGTMVLANDGHVCFSMVEKNIDDYLYEKNINHEKEILYPGESRIKTDWEIFGFPTRVFIEYFGLIRQEDYAVRVENKVQIARKNGIKLIGLHPGDDWKSIIMKALRQTAV